VLITAAPALGEPAKSVTATGTALIKVSPKNRHRNSSIKAAVEAAHKAGIAGAMRNAHEYALDYARAAGLRLGAIISVSDAQTNGPGYFGFGFAGPFGPDQFCGTIRRAVVKIVAGKRKVVRGKKVHRCFVPPFQPTTLTVTYAAS
jgi:hypothetical protein